MANKSWETVRDAVASATDATLQGAREVVSKTSEKTVEQARTIGRRMSSGLSSMKVRLSQKSDEK